MVSNCPPVRGRRNRWRGKGITKRQNKKQSKRKNEEILIKGSLPIPEEEGILDKPDTALVAVAGERSQQPCPTMTLQSQQVTYVSTRLQGSWRPSSISRRRCSLVGACFASVHGLILTLALVRVLTLGSGDFRGELMCLKLGQLSLLRGRGEVKTTRILTPIL